MRIVVCGSANMDMIVKVPQLPEPGQTVLGEELVMVPGGKGANQAVAAVRLGAEVAFLTRLGVDALGQRLRTLLETNGLPGERLLVDEQAPSGVALIIVDAQGENVIAVSPGANARLSPEDVQANVDALDGAQVLLLQLEVPLEAVEEAVRQAKRRGVRVILNPAPARPLPPGLLGMVDVLTPNAREAFELSGVRVHDGQSAREAAAVLQHSGVPAVVVTLGAAGAMALSPEAEGLVPAFPVQAVDATAAGDAFNAGLAVSLAAGRGLLEAVRYASAVAALAVTRVGAQPSLPYASQVEELLASQ